MTEKVNVKYKNPFPVTAVANFYNSLQNDLIVETNAIKKIKKIFDTWISNKSDGITIAVQGEYGTGKTQLAIEMQRYIFQYNKKYHFICLDNPSNSYLEMYKNRFLNEITKEQVIERLEACYHEIIINDMAQNKIYEKAIETNKNMTSLELIECFGLAKSRYDLIFEKKLVEVTKNKKFVNALLLLMETRFEKEVWDWFNGEEASKAMKERGVNFSIDDDSIALETIGIFAFLFGQNEHCFILFIDEMEKIISNTEKNKKGSFEALKNFIEMVKATKSMLILCGLPDYYVALPKDIQQRIGYEVKTKGITLKEIKEYVRNANEKVNRKKSYIPFCEKILENILDISSGNIRTIIRLLYHSGVWYSENNLELNEKALSEIVTNAYGTFDLTSIRRVLSQVFISNGWSYEEKKSYKQAVIDFWLPSILTKENTLDNGIEIYLIQNLLSEEEYKEISERINNNTNNCKIFVVEGFINDYYYKQLTEGGRHVFRYNMPEFKELFVSFIEGEKIRHENSVKQDRLSILNEKIERLSKIISSSIKNINENTIGKQEFYYFVRRLLDVKEDFYTIPDKDSECYLLINEIHKAINTFERTATNEHGMGVLYLYREFSYILYYLLEKPDKLPIYIKRVDVYSVTESIFMLTDHFSISCGTNFQKVLDNYQFILKYLCNSNYFNSERVVYRSNTSKTDIFLMDMIYSNDFFYASNKIKQISQIFCSELLAIRPEVINNYNTVFSYFYYFMYGIEPKIIRRETIDYDIEVVREYYDILMRYFTSYRHHNFGENIEKIFVNYEKGLRNMIYER